MATNLTRLIEVLQDQLKRRPNRDRNIAVDPWSTRNGDWNSLTHWNAYYKDLLNDPERRDRIQYRSQERILFLCRFVADWPISKVLCAGCGIAPEPQLFAWLGFQVIAVDLSSIAICWAEAQKWTIDELAKTIWSWEKDNALKCCSYKIVHDPVRARSILRELHREGGSVVYQVGDWGSLNGKFELIYCNNGLRASTKSYWGTALQNFQRLLAPGGFLVVMSLNAIDIEEEISSMARNAGYEVLSPTYVPEPTRLPVNEFSITRKHFLGLWPTG